MTKKFRLSLISKILKKIYQKDSCTRYFPSSYFFFHIPEYQHFRRKNRTFTYLDYYKCKLIYFGYYLFLITFDMKSWNFANLCLYSRPIGNKLNVKSKWYQIWKIRYCTISANLKNSMLTLYLGNISVRYTYLNSLRNRNLMFVDSFWPPLLFLKFNKLVIIIWFNSSILCEKIVI